MPDLAPDIHSPPGAPDRPWRSARGSQSPRQVVGADDSLTADAAFRLVSQGTGILWQGDYHNARQLLQALGRRIDQRAVRNRSPASDDPAAVFHTFRLGQAQRAHMLSLLAVPVDGGTVPLRRAPDVAVALFEAGMEPANYAVPLTDLLAFISSREWRKNGVAIAALDGARIHPHYGVFPPTRQDYIDLVASAPLPPSLATAATAFDIGTGSGVLAAVLARKVDRVVATDNAPRAIACAIANIANLGLADRVVVEAGDLFPSGRADLVVCNPPWLPGKADTSLETAVYDPASQMLRGFLGGLRSHLNEGGEGWLILSDLAELLQLRTREGFLGLIAGAGLQVVGRLDTKPSHGKVRDTADPLHFARSRETVSLWRLAPAA